MQCEKMIWKREPGTFWGGSRKRCSKLGIIQDNATGKWYCKRHHPDWKKNRITKGEKEKP